MKKVLSIKECKEKSIIYYVYINGWYSYEIDGKTTLIDNNGKIVIDNIDYCWTYGNGWYDCTIDGKTTLYDSNREIVVKNINNCYVYTNGWYCYRINDKETLIDNNGKIILKDVDNYYIHSYYCEYKIDGETYYKNFDRIDYEG